MSTDAVPEDKDTKLCPVCQKRKRGWRATDRSLCSHCEQAGSEGEGD